MKKLIFIAALAAAILPGCTKNEVKPEVPDQPISFTTAVGSSITKTVIDDNVFPTTEQFATFAYWLDEGETWPDDATKAKEYIPFGTDSNSRTLVSYDEEQNLWTTATPYYWPTTGSLTFFSFYHPQIKEVTFDTTKGLQFSRDLAGSDDQGKDIMVADVVTEQTKNTDNANGSGFNGVPTKFRHVMSQVVDFFINTEMDYTNGHGDGTWQAGDISITLNSIKIRNVYVKATYTSGLEPSEANPGTWSEYAAEGGHMVTYTWFDATQDDEFQVTSTKTQVPDATITVSEGTDSYDVTRGAILILPQSFVNSEYPENADADIEVIYTITYHIANGGTIEEQITREIKLAEIHAAQNNAWQMNKKITYNLTIGLDQILWAPSVVSWDDSAVEEDHDVDVSPTE